MNRSSALALVVSCGFLWGAGLDRAAARPKQAKAAKAPPGPADLLGKAERVLLDRIYRHGIKRREAQARDAALRAAGKEPKASKPKPWGPGEGLRAWRKGHPCDQPQWGFWLADGRVAEGLKARDLKAVACGLAEGGRLVDNRYCDAPHCMRWVRSPEVWDTVVRYAPDSVLQASSPQGNTLTVLRLLWDQLPPARVERWTQVLLSKGVSAGQREAPLPSPKPLFVDKAKPAAPEVTKAAAMSAADERALNAITADIKAIDVQIGRQEELLRSYGAAPSSVTGTDCDRNGLNCKARRQGGGESAASYSRRMDAQKALDALRERRRALVARGHAILAKYPGAK